MEKKRESLFIGGPLNCQTAIVAMGLRIHCVEFPPANAMNCPVCNPSMAVYELNVTIALPEENIFFNVFTIKEIIHATPLRNLKVKGVTK